MQMVPHLTLLKEIHFPFWKPGGKTYLWLFFLFSHWELLHQWQQHEKGHFDRAAKTTFIVHIHMGFFALTINSIWMAWLHLKGNHLHALEETKV